jgi:hypothetical protein
VSHSSPVTPHDRAVVDRLVIWSLAIVLAGQAAAGVTESDIWGHTAIGLDTLAAGHLLRVDPYSFTHDQPWINHEWLWDVVSAALYKHGGLAGLLALRACLIGAVLWMATASTRDMPAWARGLALFALSLVCSALWQGTRPQLASLALYGLVLLNLSAMWLPAVFALWANVHGGWMIGFGAVAAFTAVHRSPRQIAILAACAGATLVNPYGVHLWTSLADAIGRGWADVSEWAPVWSRAGGLAALWIWVGLAALVWLIRRRIDAPRWAWAWTILTLAAAARSRRLMAFAAVTAALLLLPSWRSAAGLPLPRWTGPRRAAAAAVLAAATAVALSFVVPTADCFPPAAGWRAPEPDAVQFIRESGLTGNALVHFDFGEYAFFHLRDRIKVSIDNRRETVYSDAVLQDHLRFYAGQNPDYPDRLGAAMVWLPTSMTEVIASLETRGWIRRFDGPNTIILLKAAGPVVRGGTTVGTPCFPFQ